MYKDIQEAQQAGEKYKNVKSTINDAKPEDKIRSGYHQII